VHTCHVRVCEDEEHRSDKHLHIAQSQMSDCRVGDDSNTQGQHRSHCLPIAKHLKSGIPRKDPDSEHHQCHQHGNVLTDLARTDRPCPGTDGLQCTLRMRHYVSYGLCEWLGRRHLPMYDVRIEHAERRHKLTQEQTEAWKQSSGLLHSIHDPCGKA